MPAAPKAVQMMPDTLLADDPLIPAMQIEETLEEMVGDQYEENMRRAHAEHRKVIEERIRHLQTCLSDLTLDDGLDMWGKPRTRAA